MKNLSLLLPIVSMFHLLCFEAMGDWSLATPSVTASISTSASIGLSSVVISAANPARKYFMLYNNSANSVYITFAHTSSSAGCSVIIPTFASWAPPAYLYYTGEISGIRNAGVGSVNITEFQ